MEARVQEAHLGLRQAGFRRMLVGKFTPADAELGELAADFTNSALGRRSSLPRDPGIVFTLCF